MEALYRRGWDATGGGHAAERAPGGTAMAMDVWYELRIREMSDVNEAAHELVRDAEASASDSPDRDEEE